MSEPGVSSEETGPNRNSGDDSHPVPGLSFFQHSGQSCLYDMPKLRMICIMIL